MHEYLLNGDWLLREEPLSTTIEQYGQVIAEKKEWLKAPVPGDVHQALLAADKIPEPLEGLNSFQTKWIEDRSWWYVKTFISQEDWFTADVVELNLDGLDAMAEIFFNGVYLGQHPSTFRPFVKDVKDLLKSNGEKNILVVRLTPGLEHFSQQDISNVAPYVSTESVGERGDKRRVYVRKPQYSFGWDWNPRLATCGITGDVRIRPLKTAVFRDVHVITELAGEKAWLNFKVNIESLDWIGTSSGEVMIEVIDETGQSFKTNKEVFLCSGYNYLNLKLELKNPKLWWPNGMGEQHLYQIKVSAIIENEKIVYPEFKYGARTVELDQQKLNEDERLFALIVNGVRTYSRGANWIPADSIYGRITDERYEKLIKEAREANFTMLRIWGGGLYERDCFYQYCDREGIMIWQDFMFACGAYPDHEEWFVDEVKKEIEYQTKRLHNYASIVLWSGSNENNWGFRDWWNEETKGGARLYNKVIPEIVSKNSPEVPYWNGSPYGGAAPNSAKIGDRHHWHDCMMNEEMEKRITPEEYDLVDPKFISEYGYVGPSTKESILKYLAGEPFDRQGKAWQHHNNTFEKNTVMAGIKKHYADPEDITIDEYLLYAGLCQGVIYEYSLDSFRSRKNCSGGLFWMYNDCWGEVGWTIIDYYLQRKISYNFVRRANAPIRLIMRERDNEIKIIVANDTQNEIKEELEYGYLSFAGKINETDKIEITAKPYQRTVVVSSVSGEYDLKAGILFARLTRQGDILPAVFRAHDFRELNLAKAELKIVETEVGAQTSRVKVKADNFAHAVHFNLPAEYKLSDEYFDLLPGETRTVVIKGEGLTEDMIKPVSVN